MLQEEELKQRTENLVSRWIADVNNEIDHGMDAFELTGALSYVIFSLASQNGLDKDRTTSMFNGCAGLFFDEERVKTND